ncbi:MAG: hypothetical protein ACTSYJ_02030 [Candidatus Thorarchaeota archaeon]
MRTRVLLVVVIVFIVMLALYPTVDADEEIVIPSEIALDLIPVITE